MKKLKSPYLPNIQLLWLLTLITLWILIMVLPKSYSFLIMWHITSISASSIDLPIMIDSTNMTFILVVLFISSNVMHFSSFYMQDDPFETRFNMLVLLFVSSMLILLFIPNMIALLLGWDGLGLVSFLLVIYYQNPKSLAAGMITALTNRIGDVMLILSIILMLTQGHWTTTYFWTSNLSYLTAVTLSLATMTKSAQLPFSSWLPAAMAAPTPVSALVHSSTLVTAGVFLLIRFYPFLSSFLMFNKFIIMVGASTMLMAGFSATMEWDLKKIIALSTLSQLGVMVTSVGMGYPSLAMFHLLTHALFKALLFLTAGTIIAFNNHAQDLRSMGAIAYQMPLTSSMFMIANLALCGWPFLAGFYSKDLIIEMVLFNPTNIFLSLMVLLATALTVAYSLRLFISCFLPSKLTYPLSTMTDPPIEATLPSLLLSSGSIFSGTILSSSHLPLMAHPILPMTLKLLTLSIILSTAIMSWMIFKISPQMTSMKPKNMLMTFMSTMFFLTPLSTQTPIKSPLKLGQFLTKCVDQGWTEKLTGQGFHAITKSLSNPLQPIINLPILTTLLLAIILISPIIISSM